ncbi:MAG: hypothetical protein QXO21_02980 [Candidatus Anstonellales archaeon]
MDKKPEEIENKLKSANVNISENIQNKQKLKIFRRKFFFTIKKRFFAKRTYKYTDISQLPLIPKIVYGIKESLEQSGLIETKIKQEPIIGKEKEAKKTIKQKDEELRKIKVISPTSLAKKLLGVMLIFIAFISFSIYLIMVQAGMMPISESLYLKTKFDVVELDNGLIPFRKDNVNSQIFYSLVNVTAMNITNMSYRILISNKPIYANVYVLHLNPSIYSQYQESYLAFVNLLKKKFSDSGIYVHEVEMEDLDDIADNSILIIPVNYIPAEFIQNDAKLLRVLFNKGIFIFYIGDTFDKVVTNEGKIIQMSYDSYEFRIKFAKKGSNEYNQRVGEIPKISDSLNIKSREYIILTSSDNLKITADGLQYIYRDEKGSGILFFPVALSSGWDKIEDAVDDVFNVYASFSYYPVIQKGFGNLNSGSNILLIEDLNPNFDNLYYIAIFNANATSGTEYRKILFHRVEALQKGVVYLEPPKGKSNLVSNLISSEKSLITIDFVELSNELSDVYLHIYSGEQKLYTQKLKGGPFLVNLKIIGKEIDLPVPPGGYVIVATKDEQGNIIIGKTYVKIDEPEIIPLFDLNSWQEGRFNFSIVSKSSKQPYSFDKVDVYFDNRFVGSYNTSPFMARLNEPAEQGEHTFKFVFSSNEFANKISDDKKYTLSLTMNYIKPYNWYEDPNSLIAFGISVFFVIVSRFIKPPEEKIFYLTVPDFPQSKINKVKVKPDFFIALFDRVNRRYGWQYMPLTIEELKKAIYDLDLKGKKLIVNDYNLELVLNALVERGLIKKYKYYFCPTEWEEKTKFDIEYLTIIRMIRETALSLAIKYQINLEHDRPNFIFTFPTKEIFVFAYSKNKNLSIVLLPYLSREEVILVFGDIEEKNNFIDSIYSDNLTDTQIKIAYLNNNLKLITVDEVKKYLLFYK